MFWWPLSEKEYKEELLNSIIAHFSYHHMYELCSKAKFYAAYSKVKKKEEKPSFWSVATEMVNSASEN